MKISSKATFAASLMLGTMLLIAVSIGWANAQVRAAVAQRHQSVEIVDALNNMRMVSFEYLLNRRDRARLQEQIVWERLERLFASPVPLDGAAALGKDLVEEGSAGDDARRLAPERGHAIPLADDEPGVVHRRGVFGEPASDGRLPRGGEEVGEAASGS